MNLYQYATQIKREIPPPLPGLQAVTGSPLSRRNPDIGATVTRPGKDAPIEVAGLPSVKIVRLGRGGVAVEITLRTRYAATLDITALQVLAARMVQKMESQSQGPLNTARLRALGHPFGRDKGGQNRRVPRFIGGTQKGRKSVGHPLGVRGSVPTRNVINRQSGELAASWESEVVHTSSGAMMRLINSSAHARYVAMGTRRMVAHGPWTYIPVMMRSQLMSQWQRSVRQARQKQIEAQVLAGGFRA